MDKQPANHCTQKKLNKLIDKCREDDEKTFGSATVKTIDLNETLCSMNLAVNLCKAFLSAVVWTLPDFWALMSSDITLSEESRAYY